MIEYRLIRSKRKSIALIIEPDGRLLVRAPHNLHQSYVEAFVSEKSAWIQEKQALVGKMIERCGRSPGAPRRFRAGETFWYLGRYYPLEISAELSAPLVFDGTFRLARPVQKQAALVFERWYKHQARQLLSQRLNELAAQHGFHYKSMRLSSARTRWGSCSSLSTISLNWRLVMAPPDVSDYVILHELAHLKEKNHSRRFWELLASLKPDYAVQRQWLKTHGDCLAWP